MDSDVVRGRRQELLIVADMMLADSFTIPRTGYRRNMHESLVEGSLESRIGEVTGHVVLEKYIVFITDLNKVFCYPISAQTPALDVLDPLELTSFYTASPTESFGIRDIQGAFTRFAVFTQEGCVLTASQDLLDAFWESYRTRSDDSSLTSPSADLIPSLQARGVMSIAFGDHHFLALSSNGNVTAYGKESESCGALGLGETTSKLRGMIIGLGGRDTNRLPEGEGRTVWFEPLMATWLTDMQRQGAIKGEGRERAVMLKAGDEVYRKAYADYFGKEGAKWEEKVTQEGEMGAYFVLKVAAAGWSSAALVLVDEEKAERARESHRVHPPPERPPPSPTLSMQSNDSYEHIDSPGEQLTNAVYAIYEWVWRLGRSFLGLTKRDVRRETEREQGCEEGYIWSKEPFPRLRLPDGKAMPGDVPLTE